MCVCVVSVIPRVCVCAQVLWRNYHRALPECVAGNRVPRTANYRTRMVHATRKPSSSLLHLSLLLFIPISFVSAFFKVSILYIITYSSFTPTKHLKKKPWPKMPFLIIMFVNFFSFRGHFFRKCKVQRRCEGVVVLPERRQTTRRAYHGCSHQFSPGDGQRTGNKRRRKTRLGRKKSGSILIRFLYRYLAFRSAVVEREIRLWQENLCFEKKTELVFSCSV